MTTFWRTGVIAAFLLTPLFIRCQPAAQTFTNPLLPSGPDPWVIQWNGYYYYMNSTGQNLTIWKTKDITDLKNAEKKVVWTPPPSGPYSREIWAPELHRLQDKWYLYFAADAGSNESHRVWVLENSSADPLEGTWQMKGKLSGPDDRWAIDPSIFENKGQAYAVWSGWEGATNGVQKIFIAQLANPWTLGSKPVVISSPEFPWEKVGDLTMRNRIDPIPHVDVNEGPEILQHDGKIMLSIDDAVALALENNLDIGIARYNLNIADTDVLRAKSGANNFLGANSGVVQNTSA